MSVSRPHICLSMIVRNESAILDRCLSSALPIVDAAVVCDTGSTDDTPARAHEHLVRAGVPFRIARHAWTGFGPNRTAALAEAADFVSGLGWPRGDTYWLLLDADHELIVQPGFDRGSLRADAIALRQCRRAVSHWNLRLARASRGWTVVGRTHERYTCPEQPPFEQMTGLHIRDHGDGGSKADKLARDIAWLSEQLAANPDDPRTLFYLAQTYRGSGDAMKALLLYRRRIAVADGDEEAWYSKYCIGQILAAADHADAATAMLREALAMDPARAEPWYELSRLQLRHGRRDDAIVSAQRGRALPVPTDRYLFVHTDVYQHKLDLQLAEAAVGSPHSGLGRAACDRVLLSRSAPADALESARRLAVHYAAPLAAMEFLPLRPQLPDGYVPCNPSISRDEHGYWVVCRAVNYEQRRLRYRSRDDDGVFRTCNVLMRLDQSFEVVYQNEILLADPPLREGRVRGLEDCRLFPQAESLQFLCVTADRHPSGFVHQSICSVDTDGRATAHRPLLGAFDDRTQKNWLPFRGDGNSLCALYAYDPLRVLLLSASSGTYRVEREIMPAVNAVGWRGSAGPVRWPDRPDGGWLVLIHEAVRREGPDAQAERVYLHRFVEYDNDFRLRRLSFPFVFAHKGIEFACGMTTTGDGRHLVIGLGIEDREAFLARIATTAVARLLEAPPG